LQKRKAPLFPIIPKSTGERDCSISDELRKELEGASVEVLGVKESVARIELVTDTDTGSIDGTLTHPYPPAATSSLRVLK
jgi:hypothetical protein